MLMPCLDKHSDSSRKHLPDAAAVYSLLGKLYKGYGELKKAAEHYVAALKLNPFMWDAFEDLCDAGSFLMFTSRNPHLIFRRRPDSEFEHFQDDPRNAGFSVGAHD